MKIAPALWPGRRKTPKIRHLAEPLLWLLLAGLAVMALTGPAAARASTPAPAAPKAELTAPAFNGACLKHVMDFTAGQTEEQVVAEINRRCFRLSRRAAAAVSPRAPNCANAFTWGPALAASPRTGPCFRQSTAGWPPGWYPLAGVPFLSAPLTGSRPSSG